MAVLINPDCRDGKHASCPGYGWDEEADQADHCPCPCHQEGPRCGQPHEAERLAYLGLCVADEGHDGPHEFTGPIEGTVISVTLGDGWDRTRTTDPGVDEVLEDLAKAMAPRPEP